MIEEGAPAPDFTLRNQDDEDVTLSDLRGRPVVPAPARERLVRNGIRTEGLPMSDFWPRLP